jgi:hypothetical protein
MIFALAILAQGVDGGSGVARAGEPCVEYPGQANYLGSYASKDGHGKRCGFFSSLGCHAEGKDLYYSCGVQGSYKFPVPPLYTYHWPGMYSQVRMTDYHSPWRFPPLKPYTEESKTLESKTTSQSARLQTTDR